MERSYFLFIYNPFALQEFNGNFKWKKSNKIEKSSSSFFFLFLLFGSWFICFLFCFVDFVVFFCFFFFFIKLTFLFKTQFVGSLLRNTWAEYNCSVAKSNQTRLASLLNFISSVTWKIITKRNTKFSCNIRRLS